MKKLLIPLLILIISITGSSFATSDIDYNELQKASTFSIDESGKWKIEKMIMVYEQGEVSAADAAVFTFSGEKGKRITFPPMIYFTHSPTPDNEELESIILGIDTLKAYKISAAPGKEFTMIPLTATLEEMIFDLSTCDEITVVLNYSKTEHRFKLNKEDYAPFKEFFDILLKSNAIYSMDEFFASGWDNMCSVEHTFLLP